MTPDDELVRALADPDPTIRRIAAVRAHKLPLASPPRVLAALEPLLAHEDKYLRRAAASSYVVLHPRGPAAPALRPLHDDPADVVVLTARGALRDSGHEIAELAFVVRTLAHATAAAPPVPFATTMSRWHRFLWSYSPNPTAAALPNEPLEDDIARFRVAIAALAPPSVLTMLQLRLDTDELVARGFVHGAQAWQAATAAKLPALRRLAELPWEADDTPWPRIFASGAFALAVAHVIDAIAPVWRAGAERELSAALGEPIFLGFLRARDVAYAE